MSRNDMHKIQFKFQKSPQNPYRSPASGPSWSTYVPQTPFICPPLVEFLNTPLFTSMHITYHSCICLGVCSGPVVIMLNRQPWSLKFKSRPGQKFGSRFLLHLRPLANSAMTSTLIAHCQWEDETVSERTGHPPSYAEAKKTKSLTLHSHGCPMASLKRPIFFFFFVSLLVPG